MRYTTTLSALLLLFLTLSGCAAANASSRPQVSHDLQTAAERTGDRATTTYPEVVRLVSAIARTSPLAQRTSIGTSYEDRDIPMLVIADPPITTPEQAHDSGKLIAYVFGGIHSGEACGKEALLHIARNLVLDPDDPAHRKLLNNVVLLVVPLYNPDADVRRSPGNRPGQIGPIDGMGQRRNAQDLDLNRDHVKLEAPETRAQVRLLNTWRPHLIIDTHTTNGSYHRLDLTYAPPLNPSGNPALLAYAQDEFLPNVEQRLRTRHDIHTAPYGNFDRKKTTWTTYSANPMFGGPYRGLRHQFSILSEAYAYATFADRVRSTELFVLECLTLAAEQQSEIRSLIDSAQATIPDTVGIKHEFAPPTAKRTIPGWLETLGDSDRMIPTGAHREYTVDLIDRFVATKSVTRPTAYLIPPELDHITDKLLEHGIRVDPVTARRTVNAETYRITTIERSDRPFQGHHMVRLTSEPETAPHTIGPGWSLVDTTQPLGTLAVYLLEPDSDGGLAIWNFFDDHIEEGGFWPILREPVTTPGSQR